MKDQFASYFSPQDQAWERTRREICHVWKRFLWLIRWKRNSIDHWQLYNILMPEINDKFVYNLSSSWPTMYIPVQRGILCDQKWSVCSCYRTANSRENPTYEQNSKPEKSSNGIIWPKNITENKHGQTKKHGSIYPGARATANHAKIPGIATQRIVLLGPNLDHRNWNRQVDRFSPNSNHLPPQ